MLKGQKCPNRDSKPIKTLRNTDVYSLLLFALYTLHKEPEYSTLSELSFILDRESMLKLCEYYGGMTITIPTIEDLESLTEALLVYQNVDIDGLKKDRVLLNLRKRLSNDVKYNKIVSDYVTIKEMLKDYDFTSRPTNL